MEVRCDKCQARYRVDDARIGPQGLTMRCGKCQNTFKVMRPADAAGASLAPAGPPAASKAPRPAALGDEGAARTMMFQTAPVRPPPAPKTERAGAAVMLGSSSAPQTPPRAATHPPAIANQPEATPPLHDRTAEGAANDVILADSAREASRPPPEGGARSRGIDPVAFAEGAGPRASQGSAFDRSPPKGLLIGIAATLLVILLAGVSLVLWKKGVRRPPPAAAIETLSAAESDASRDTLASLASAETKARDALQIAGPQSRFPQAVATLAEIEVQWADALNDEAALLAARDPNDANAASLQEQAKAKLKSALDALSPAVKADPKSPELQLALAGYHRAQRATANMTKALRKSAVPRDDPRVAAILGMAASQEEDAEKAIQRLRTALGGAPQSARLHFRLAQAYAAMKDEVNARAELKETLRISPQHERARQLLEQLAPQAPTESR